MAKTYEVEKLPDGCHFYSNLERTGFYDKVKGGYEITLYSHPDGKFAWRKEYHTPSQERAQRAALHWCRDGVEYTLPGLASAPDAEPRS